jgi:cytidylate kinase
MQEYQNNIITIDGPAGAGKTSVARGVAHRLGWNYLDTGALYRAITYYALKDKVNLDDKRRLVSIARSAKFDVRTVKGNLRILLNNEDITEKIRSPRVTENASIVASVDGVREVLRSTQRQLARGGRMVVEGRDIGTVVFPHAKFKFYLDATITERAKRRWQDLKTSGKQVDMYEIKQAIARRDERDTKRGLCPLMVPEDAYVIDSTMLSQAQVVDIIVKKITNG